LHADAVNLFVNPRDLWTTFRKNQLFVLRADFDLITRLKFRMWDSELPIISANGRTNEFRLKNNLNTCDG